MVKITAYDYSIYGGLKGKVTIISPDTLRDEVKQDQFYYRVYIRAESDKLINMMCAEKTGGFNLVN